MAAGSRVETRTGRFPLLNGLFAMHAANAAEMYETLLDRFESDFDSHRVIVGLPSRETSSLWSEGRHGLNLKTQESFIELDLAWFGLANIEAVRTEEQFNIWAVRQFLRVRTTDWIEGRMAGETLAHEFGHELLDRSNCNDEIGLALRRAVSIGLGFEPGRDPFPETDSEVREAAEAQLGEYAGTNFEELIAEAFRHVITAEDPPRVSVAVGRVFDHYFGIGRSQEFVTVEQFFGVGTPVGLGDGRHGVDQSSAGEIAPLLNPDMSVDTRPRYIELEDGSIFELVAGSHLSRFITTDACLITERYDLSEIDPRAIHVNRGLPIRVQYPGNPCQAIPSAVMRVVVEESGRVHREGVSDLPVCDIVTRYEATALAQELNAAQATAEVTGAATAGRTSL